MSNCAEMLLMRSKFEEFCRATQVSLATNEDGLYMNQLTIELWDCWHISWCQGAAAGIRECTEKMSGARV